METSADGLSAFMTARPRLFGIAYRMLGSVAEAEDIVQDVWMRWQGTDRSEVRDPSAFLATTTTRLAINLAQSARSRREQYVGPWLPEPVDTRTDPTLGAETDEALGFAVLMLLERLSPAERAAYVLREAFHYSYEAIAGILELGEANVRQLVSRARKHIIARQLGPVARQRAAVSRAEQGRLLVAFIAAAQQGDFAELERLLAADVVSCSDGNGRVGVARVPVVGRDQVAKFVTKFSAHFWIGVTLEWIDANGQSCVVISREGTVLALATIDASEQGIDRILWVMNPDKLVTIG